MKRETTRESLQSSHQYVGNLGSNPHHSRVYNVHTVTEDSHPAALVVELHIRLDHPHQVDDSLLRKASFFSLKIGKHLFWPLLAAQLLSNLPVLVN